MSLGMIRLFGQIYFACSVIFGFWSYGRHAEYHRQCQDVINLHASRQEKNDAMIGFYARNENNLSQIAWDALRWPYKLAMIGFAPSAINDGKVAFEKIEKITDAGGLEVKYCSRLPAP